MYIYVVSGGQFKVFYKLISPKGILSVIPQGIVEVILQDTCRRQVVRYSVLCMYPHYK